MNYLLFSTAFALSTVAAYYSIAGLMMIFAAASTSIAVMGVILEIAKIITVSWLQRNWKTAPFLLKSYFSVAVVVLMLITSLGIFGYLSRAHIEQTAPVGDVAAKIALIEDRISIEKSAIVSNRKILEQMDDAVSQVLSRSTSEAGARRSANLRKSQEKERNRISIEIQSSQDKIVALEEEKLPLTSKVRKVEAEVGPIKYVASFFYGETSPELLEKAVTWMIITIIFVFDPLAVLLFVAFNRSTSKPSKSTETKSIDPIERIEPVIESDNNPLPSENHYTKEVQSEKSNSLPRKKSLKKPKDMNLKDSSSVSDKISLLKTDLENGETLKYHI